jgi:hypothetical protein
MVCVVEVALGYNAVARGIPGFRVEGGFTIADDMEE